MTCLIKTVAELLEVPGTTINTDTRIRLLGSEISFPRKKQEQICGNIVFCYRQPNGNLVAPKRNRDIVDIWLIPDWIIDKILVE